MKQTPKATSKPQLSMTDFVDIVHQSGTPKATKIKQVKERPEYHPAFDFYKPVREAIIDTHQNGRGKPEFRATAGAVTDPKKLANYPTVIAGYSKWWGSKNFSWFTPPRDVFSSSGVDIVVNPELGLKWEDQVHVVKLYFKEAAIDKYRSAVILDLMERVLRLQDDEAQMSVLDVRRSRIYTRNGGPLTSIPLVEAEMAFIATLWSHL